MSLLEAINSNHLAADPVAWARIRRIVAMASETGETGGESRSNVVLSVNLDLPRLERADELRHRMRTVDAHGRLNELTVNFRKVDEELVQVDINGAGLTTGGVASFDIHLNQSGSIRGFDTDGSGRVDSIEAPNVDFTGRGELVQFNFDDRGLGPLDFEQFDLGARYLDLLQSGGISSSGGGGGSGSGGASTIEGTSGDDVLSGTAAADGIDGGAGSDTVDYSTDIAAVLVDIANLTATDGSGSTDTLVSIENATGFGLRRSTDRR